MKRINDLFHINEALEILQINKNIISIAQRCKILLFYFLISYSNSIWSCVGYGD